MSARRLIALEPDELMVVSAHVQDSKLRVADVRWRPAEQRLILAVQRPDWEAQIAGTADAPPHDAVLRFERVRTCQARGVDMSDPLTLLTLLAVDFRPLAAPGGEVLLHFAEGATLRLTVECLECELADLA